MANLIITIISIALVAVAALMGAYYGGSAFIQGQAKANANTLIAQGEQLVAAWSVYAADRGGAWDLSALADLSSNSYLTSLPAAPASIVNGSATSVWTPINLSSTAGAYTTYDGVYVRLADSSAGVNVCNYVAQAIAGSAGVATSISASTNMLPGSPTRKFDCVYVGSASLSVPAVSTTAKFVYYRAY